MFFQAEDGIRDLVRSRGLGDVYKRQVVELRDLHAGGEHHPAQPGEQRVEVAGLGVTPQAVSYTHLTLPTSDLV